MFPISCPLRIIYPRVKNEFSQDIPLPEPLDLLLAFCVDGIGFQDVCLGVYGQLALGWQEFWKAGGVGAAVFYSEAGPQEGVNHCGFPAFSYR